MCALFTNQEGNMISEPQGFFLNSFSFTRSFFKKSFSEILENKLEGIHNQVHQGFFPGIFPLLQAR